VICVLAIIANEGSVLAFVKNFQNEIINDPMTTLKVGFPAVAYTISNNCLFLSTQFIDASTAQVLYQAKLLATAGFSIALLGSSLTCTKWSYLILLTAGAMAVQFNAQSHEKEYHDGSNPVAAVVVIAVGCLCSSGAGVWFEKMLKDSKTSIWIRNIQLGGLSVVVGLLGVYLYDFHSVAEGGFLRGYTYHTWALIFNQAAGGLLVAFACKYADNILKNFATTLSIVSSTLVLWLYFPSDSPLSVQFSIGASLVLGSTYAYGREDATLPAPRKIQEDSAQVDQVDIEKCQC